MDKWREYEAEKQKLKDKNLPPDSYERELELLCARLGI